jgi:hypothetical protein
MQVVGGTRTATRDLDVDTTVTVENTATALEP